MPCRWKTKVDADEAVVVVMNVPEKCPGLPDWQLVTLSGSIAGSGRKMCRYFSEEIKNPVPQALKYSGSRG